VSDAFTGETPAALARGALARGWLRDAVMFFLLLVLLLALAALLKPVQVLDRWLGTRLLDPLVDLIERIAEWR
jgi:hypothetical protein